MSCGCTLTALLDGEAEGLGDLAKWLETQAAGGLWQLDYPKGADQSEISYRATNKRRNRWMYVNHKDMYMCTSREMTATEADMIGKYAVATRRGEAEKGDTEVCEAFYRFDKGLIFVITSEFSTFAARCGTTDPKTAEENTGKTMRALEDYLRAYNYIVKLH